MWGNFLAQSELAKERIAAALERTGDILTDHATAHVAKQSQQRQQSAEQDKGKQEETKSDNKDNNEASSSSAQPTVTTSSPTMASSIPAAPSSETSSTTTTPSQPPPSNDFFKNIQSGWGVALTAANQIATKTATSLQQQQQPPPVAAEATGSSLTKGGGVDETRNAVKLWGLSVWDSAREVVEATKRAAEREFTPLKRRDPALPLDVEALKDAEVVYVTDRLIASGHPALQSSTNGDITPERKLAAVGHLLNKRHKGKFMVWNLSEVEYDYSVLDDQVLSFQFPGSPSPPLGLMLKLLLSIESWLKADPANVCVVHCLTGKGRTSTVLAAFLCWMGEAGFHDVNQALEYIAACKKVDVDTLTIPSQRRYAMYFANMLDGVRPHQPPLLLKRIIMSEAPKFGKDPHERNTPADIVAPTVLGCSPYLQIFKAGQLILTTTAQSPTGTTGPGIGELPFVPSDSTVIFTLDSVVQGDILIRCRHLTKRGQRVSMFRAAFHTGYTPPKVMRLTKAQLDGACHDPRFPDGFFADLIFEACDASTASKHLVAAPKSGGTGNTAEGTPNVGTTGAGSPKNEAEARRQKATLQSDGGPGSASSFEYDTMLHRDGRFWDVISARRRECLQKNVEGADDATTSGAAGGMGANGETPQLSGPTVGRRRDFEAGEGAAEGQVEGGTASKSDGGSSSQLSKKKVKKDPYTSFSIGGGDFSMAEDEREQPKVPSAPKQRDELMEALMEIDDDDLHASSTSLLPEDADVGEGEIVFSDNEEEAEKRNNLFKGTHAQADKGGDTTSQPVESSATNNPSTELSDSTKETDAPPAKVSDTKINVIESHDDDDFDEIPEGDDMVDAGESTNSKGFDYDYDDDDAELDDLENFLTKASQT